MLAFFFKEKKESYTKNPSFILDNCSIWGISEVFPKWEVPQHCEWDPLKLEEIFMVEHHSEAYLTSMGVSIQPVRTNDMYGYIYNII